MQIHKQTPSPAKRPRGRPPRVPRQPQDPSKWPPLLPKPTSPIEITTTSLTPGATSVIPFPGGILPLSVELAEEDLPSSSIQDITDGVQMGIKVRGLDLMRYGRLDNGVYKCIECERIQISKTFKTSYSFQRHAYLYHEGSPKRFPCPVCAKEFSRPDKRKSHLKEKHGMFTNENNES